DQLEPDQQRAATNVAHLRVCGTQFLEPAESVVTELVDPLEKAVLLDEACGDDTGCESKLVSPERARVRPRRPRVEPFVVEDRSDRHANAAEGLRGQDHIGDDAVLLEREPGAGTAATGLDLVDDQRDVELASYPPDA